VPTGPNALVVTGRRACGSVFVAVFVGVAPVPGVSSPVLRSGQLLVGAGGSTFRIDRERSGL